MSNLVKHAERELANMINGEEMDQMMAKHLIAMVKLFSDEGHSGFSGSYAIAMLTKLLNFEPIGPLTGEDGEWTEVSEREGEKYYQNNRCGRVFKGGDGAYDIDGAVFREPDGGCFTGYGSRVPVTFPYTPKTIYVDIPKNASDEVRALLVKKALSAESAA